MQVRLHGRTATSAAQLLSELPHPLWLLDRIASAPKRCRHADRNLMMLADMTLVKPDVECSCCHRMARVRLESRHDQLPSGGFAAFRAATIPKLPPFSASTCALTQACCLNDSAFRHSSLGIEAQVQRGKQAVMSFGMSGRAGRAAGRQFAMNCMRCKQASRF